MKISLAAAFNHQRIDFYGQIVSRKLNKTVFFLNLIGVHAWYTYAGDTMKQFKFANIPLTIEADDLTFLPMQKSFETEETPKYYLSIQIKPLVLPKDIHWHVQGKERYAFHANGYHQFLLDENDQVLYGLFIGVDTAHSELFIQAHLSKDTTDEIAYVVSGLWFMDIAVREGLVPLHAGAVSIQGQTTAFMAASKTGKSTLLNRILSNEPNTVLLNDDKIFLTLNDQKPFLYSTPFSGQAHRHEHHQGVLETLYLLAQGSHNTIEVLSTSDLLEALLRHTHRPKDNEALATLLHSLHTLVPHLSCYRFTLTNDDRAFESLMTHLKELSYAKNRR